LNEYIKDPTYQIHNISQPPLLHISLLFQTINFREKIVTLSFQKCTAELEFFRSKGVQSRIRGILHKIYSLSQVFQQGGIVQEMRTNDVKFLGQLKVRRCDNFTLLDASMSAVGKHPIITYNCTYVIV